MANSLSVSPPARGIQIVSLYQSLLDLASHIPLSLVQLASRVAIAKVFWASSHSKLASWPVTEQIFANEYNVPLLPPEVAAILATATEYTGAVLLFFGLFTRLTSLALLGMVLVIQVFVYPGNWAEHLMWSSLLLLLLSRGAGLISLDAIASRFLAPWS